MNMIEWMISATIVIIILILVIGGSNQKVKRTTTNEAIQYNECIKIVLTKGNILDAETMCAHYRVNQ
jgi:hypothetical protein